MPEWPVPRRECRAAGFKPMGKLVNRGGALVKVLARERREEAWEEVAGEQGDAVGEGAVSVGVMDGDWASSPSRGATGEVGDGVSAPTILAEGAPERGCGGAGGAVRPDGAPRVWHFGDVQGVQGAALVEDSRGVGAYGGYRGPGPGGESGGVATPEGLANKF